MRDICAQGAAHGVWNEMARRVVEGREDTRVAKVASSVISVMDDMLTRVGN